MLQQLYMPVIGRGECLQKMVLMISASWTYRARWMGSFDINIPLPSGLRFHLLVFLPWVSLRTGSQRGLKKKFGERRAGSHALRSPTDLAGCSQASRELSVELSPYWTAASFSCSRTEAYPSGPPIINNYWTRLSKISWFVSGEQINYLPKPKAEANNWSARHWQIMIFLW